MLLIYLIFTYPFIQMEPSCQIFCTAKKDISARNHEKKEIYILPSTLFTI